MILAFERLIHDVIITLFEPYISCTVKSINLSGDSYAGRLIQHKRCRELGKRKKKVLSAMPIR